MDQPYRPAGYCPRCGYPLDAAPCPECGAAFARPAARWVARWQKLRRVGVWLIAAIVLIVAGCLGVGYIFYEWWPIEHLKRLAQGTGWMAQTAQKAWEFRLEQRFLRVTERIERIEREARELPDHAWAGTYGGLGVRRLALAPSSGFMYYTGDRLVAGEFQEGPVRQNGDATLQLTPEVPRVFQATRTFTEEWLVVPWDDRICLVPAKRVRAFCIESNSGRSTIAMVRGEDGFETPRFRGAPVVPPRFRPYVLPTPLIAEVIEVIRDAPAPTGQTEQLNAMQVTFVLNRGRGHGAFAGLRFFALIDRWIYEIEAVEVQESTTRAAPSGPWCTADAAVLVDVGSKVSTRDPRADWPDFDSWRAYGR